MAKMIMISNKALIFFWIVLSPPCSAQVITTIAGTGTQGYNGDGISATVAHLNYPHNIALDADGNIYFPDYGNSRIRKITIGTGLISTIAGTNVPGFSGDGGAAISAQINQPSSMAFDNNGDLYFTDRSNQRVRKITFSTGMISTVAGTGTAGYNSDGIAATTAHLNYPNEVAFDTAGNLFIADWLNNRIRKVNKLTGIITTITGTGVPGWNGDDIPATTAQINGPCGIVFDNTGNIYIAEYYGNRIRKITLSTNLITTLSGNGVPGFSGDGGVAAAAQLDHPAYMSFDAAGNMYIGDATNYRIRKIAAGSGIINTIAGTGNAGYNGDGIPPTAAWLNQAYHPYFNNNDCSMYIADTYNHRIRKITGGFTGCLPAIAPGNKIACQVLPAVTIDNTNNNTWVPVYDSAGRVAAEILANGNNLGVVSTSLYTKTGPCREDAFFRLYLNRNISITPQIQPVSGNVSVRLYILKAELDSLRTAVNSQSQPSGVASINEVDVFKNDDTCRAIGGSPALPLTAIPGTYNADHYLQVSIPAFSSFHFANKLLPAILPVKLKTFTGKPIGNVHELKWDADCFDHVIFNIERSTDGIRFNTIGNTSAEKGDCNKPFYFSDKNILPGKNYYRLRIVEAYGTVSYSAVVLLNSSNSLNIRLMIDPLMNAALDMEVLSKTTAPVEFICTDITGRILIHRPLNVPAGTSRLVIDIRKFAKGIYWISAVGKEGRSNVIKFVK